MNKEFPLSKQRGCREMTNHARYIVQTLTRHIYILFRNTISRQPLAPVRGRMYDKIPFAPVRILPEGFRDIGNKVSYITKKDIGKATPFFILPFIFLFQIEPRSPFDKMPPRSSQFSDTPPSAVPPYIFCHIFAATPARRPFPNRQYSPRLSLPR